MEALEQITTLPWEEKQCRPPVLGWVAQGLLEDRELVLAAVTYYGRNLDVLKFYNSPLVSDRDIVEAAMNGLGHWNTPVMIFKGIPTSSRNAIE